MADSNKDLNDDLDDLLGEDKEPTRKSERTFGDSAREFGDDAKRKTNEFSDDAKQSANEFSHDAKRALDNGKNIAIIAHITLIGWIIALVMNNEKKSEFASFYIRQVLGIMLLGFVCSFIPIIGWFAWIFVLVLWVMSLISALNGQKKPILLLGEQFQDWFKSL
jgi:uncharacterized membrane protein